MTMDEERVSLVCRLAKSLNDVEAIIEQVAMGEEYTATAKACTASQRQLNAELRACLALLKERPSPDMLEFGWYQA
jgi:hypothetical protein